MTTGKITIPDNLIRTVVLAGALLGTGWKLHAELNAIETKLDTLVWDLCQQSPHPQGLRSCSMAGAVVTQAGVP